MVAISGIVIPDFSKIVLLRGFHILPYLIIVYSVFRLSFSALAAM
jgi:hypothetical protein